MLYGIKDNLKILAQPNTSALCPGCNGELIPKCGEVNIWHWAHKNAEECDIWYEPESEWHLSWKEKVFPEYVEVVVGNHRADIKNKDGVVIELQNSIISIDEAREREQFYGTMVWLVNGLDFNFDVNQKGSYYTFRYKWARNYISYSRRPMFIQFTRFFVFEIKKIYDNGYGWGYMIPTERFSEMFLHNILKEKILNEQEILSGAA